MLKLTGSLPSWDKASLDWSPLWSLVLFLLLVVFLILLSAAGCVLPRFLCTFVGCVTGVNTLVTGDSSVDNDDDVTNEPLFKLWLSNLNKSNSSELVRSFVMYGADDANEDELADSDCAVCCNENQVM